MKRIRVVNKTNAVAFITVVGICCLASSQTDASFHLQRLMKGMVRNRDAPNRPSVFASRFFNENHTRDRTKKRDKKQQRVQPLKQTFSIHQLQQQAATQYDSQGDEGDVDVSSRQKKQPTTAPTSSPTVSRNNKNSDGKDKPSATFTLSPVSVPASTTTFTISPVSVPVGNENEKGKTTNAPVRAPAIPPVPITLLLRPTETPTAKPIVSIPLDVSPDSPAPTTFFTETTTAPSTTTPVVTTTPRPTFPTTTTAVPPPSSVPIIATVTIVGNNGTVNNGTATDNAATTPNNGSSSSSSEKAGSVAIVSIVLAVMVSMILSVTVFMARHRYVQKHGAASTRRRQRRNPSQLVEPDKEIASIDTMDDPLHNIKTVHIITNHDLDTTTADASPDRTYEIHFEDDEDAVNHIYSQESSFISTSGGEEMGSDLDRNITTTTTQKSNSATKKKREIYAV